uniref:Replication protein A 70 kDa DNA-binding subunit B-like n=1 Tax=Nicotiana tabacum TaxID=4097 RepID=A0A1S4CXC6_TOBAC|nr:PREDICTED: uncharacterized protein LOC107823605 [Nicotiana tabacum]
MGLYIMNNFVVCPNNMKLKTKDHKLKLMFTHKTTVDEMHDPQFNMCIFKFRKYEQLSNPQEFDNTELFDVIGEVVSYEDVQSIKQDDNIRMYMNIQIQDYESNNISATLWGDFVEQIRPYLNGSNDKPVVVIMQLIRAHRYREQYSMRNTWHALKLLINSNLPQVVDFCSRMVSVRGESSQRITQISSHKTHSVANELASGSIEVKNIEDLGDCNHLQVKVTDCTGTISVLLWDKDATKIIGKSANDLKDAVFETSGAADDSSCLMEIKNIVEKRVMFKVEVNSSNNQNKDVVFRVVTLTDDEEIIKKYIPSPQEETFKDPDFNTNEVIQEDNEITDSTEDNELIDVAHTLAKIGLTNSIAMVEEDSNAQLLENKIKRVFKKKKIA